MEHLIDFNFKARYYKLGEIKATTAQVWFALHGYGQLGRYFIQRFERLASMGIVVIAPEALSRFYLEDVQARSKTGNNRVGATWMTRDGRETDIDNYINYLDAIYKREMSGTQASVTILGFSQGAATASRWAVGGSIRFQRLVLWAGIFPPDIDFKSGKEILRDKEVITVVGTSDPFLTAERVKEMESLSSQLSVEPRKITFDGKHELNEEILEQLAMNNEQ